MKEVTAMVAGQVWSEFIRCPLWRLSDASLAAAGLSREVVTRYLDTVPVDSLWAKTPTDIFLWQSQLREDFASAAAVREDKRPSLETTFFNIATLISARSSCRLRRVGAVLVDEKNLIIAVAYNGPTHGEPNCLEAPCVDPTSQGEGGCRGIHAEMNALYIA